jgi:hypothetical protein
LAYKCTWQGASGNTYEYTVFNNPPNFNANQEGNYIYTKLVNNTWVPVYIGEGSLSDRCCVKHHQAEAIRAKGATHVHAHLNKDNRQRKAEESDLLKRYLQAYSPIGCNERVGG